MIHVKVIGVQEATQFFGSIVPNIINGIEQPLNDSVELVAMYLAEILSTDEQATVITGVDASKMEGYVYVEVARTTIKDPEDEGETEEEEEPCPKRGYPTKRKTRGAIPEDEVIQPIDDPEKRRSKFREAVENSVWGIAEIFGDYVRGVCTFGS